MLSIMIQISIYIILAIFVGYFFGWFISNSIFKKREQEIKRKYEKEIDAFVMERVDITQKYKEVLKRVS